MVAVGLGHVEVAQRTQQLVREGGVWRVVMRDEQVASFAATGQETAQHEPSSPPQYESAGAPDDDGVTETVTIRVVGDPVLTLTGNYANIDSTRSVEGSRPPSSSGRGKLGTWPSTPSPPSCTTRAEKSSCWYS